MSEIEDIHPHVTDSTEILLTKLAIVNDELLKRHERRIAELEAALSRIAGMTGNDRDVQEIAENALKGNQP